MNIIDCPDYISMSQQAALIVKGELNKKKELLMCAATGGSPEGLYQELILQAKNKPGLFDAMQVIKLDEWAGIPEDDPVTCEFYLQNRLLKPLGIRSDRYISFNPNAEDLQQECKRIQDNLDQKGPIDLCILGLGMNGHLGLNEPGEHLVYQIHIANLSEKTLQHEMVSSLKVKPTHGLTLGMKDILASQKIILLITGRNKSDARDTLLKGEVTTSCPASFLWLHDNVDCIIDQSY